MIIITKGRRYFIWYPSSLPRTGTITVMTTDGAIVRTIVVAQARKI